MRMTRTGEAGAPNPGLPGGTGPLARGPERRKMCVSGWGVKRPLKRRRGLLGEVSNAESPGGAALFAQ